MSSPASEQLCEELRKLEAEDQRLKGENRRLRSELRRVRPSARIASSLHQDLFSPMPRGSAAASEVEPPVANTKGEDSLHEQLVNAQGTTSQRVSEVADLKKRLAAQEALQSQAAELAAILEQRSGSKADEELPAEPGPITSREARLVRETVELRQRVAQLEDRVQQLQAAHASGRQTPNGQRGEIRRLQQLDSVALHLHDELRRRRSRGSSASATSSPPRMLPSQASSRCGTSFSRMSTKSEVLGQHIEAFYNRFNVRRSNLGVQRGPQFFAPQSVMAPTA